MSKAGRQIVAGLKDAVRHARCENGHVDHHVTTKTGPTEFTTKCIKCGRSWTEKDIGDWHRLIRVVRQTNR